MHDTAEEECMTLQGGCGYGLLNKNNYPYWSVAALSTQNVYATAGAGQGCGCVLCFMQSQCKLSAHQHLRTA